jgi:pSer/pThr/pTyr-binding forkhead associated (FHA) protein
MPKLTITEGPLAGEPLEVEGEVVVGREGVDLVIDDPEISRRHVAFRRRENEIEVEDLGSLNGTFVNGSKLEAPVRLSAGDVIRLGKTSIAVAAEVQGTQVSQPTSLAPTADVTRAATPAPAPPPPVAPQPPAPEPPLAAPASSPAPAPAVAVVEAPSSPFGAHSGAPAARQRGRAASRKLGPTLISFAAILATAAVLLVYFAME